MQPAQQVVAPRPAATYLCGMVDDRLADAVLRALEDAPIPVREIALEAGLSPSTTTRLLNGEYAVGERHVEPILGALERLRDKYTDTSKELDAAAKRIRRAKGKGRSKGGAS